MEIFVAGAVALGPVTLLLLAFVYFDSYKLVAPSVVFAVIGVGLMAGVLAYLVSAQLFDMLEWDVTSYSRYMAPAVEEVLKGLVVVYLIAANRVGFLVDAAILGFAAGAGFALAENLYYLWLVDEVVLGVWVIRGFGTAIMHGAITAVFAMLTHAWVERAQTIRARHFVPGLLVAIVVHSVFNHFFLSPMTSTLLLMLLMPALMVAVFRISERALERWLGVGFDADTELIELIHSGRLSDSPVGSYLKALKERFHGAMVADLLCYLRLHVELGLRAKGLLLSRENGFIVTIDEETRSKFAELTFLEGSIGRTGILAMKPFLHVSRKDLWQLYVLSTAK